MATPLDEARSNLLDPRNLTGRAEGYHWVQRVDAQLVAEFEARIRLDVMKSLSPMFGAILGEMERADDRFGDWSLSGEELSDSEKLGPLGEEYGEVCQAVVMEMHGGMFSVAGREHHKTNLDTELVQLAAGCCNWLKSRGYEGQ